MILNINPTQPNPNHTICVFSVPR